MLRSHFAATLRHFASQRLYSAINVLGLAVGLASCLLIALYVKHESSFESGFANAGRIYRISRDYFPRDGARARVPASNNAPVAPALLEDFPEIEQTARVFGGRMLVSRGGDAEGDAFYEDRFRWADNSLFDIFDFDWIAGDPKTALEKPGSAVLTETTARKYFGNEDPLGATLTSGGSTSLTVTGVIRDLPENTHLDIDALVSMSTLPPRVLGQWNSSTDFHTYVLLRPGANIESVERGIPAFMNRRIAADASTRSGMTIMSIRDIHLHSTRDEEWKPPGKSSTVYGFAAVALLILVIACINFTNLATARAGQRAREIGVRKALGATRRELVLQLLGETMLTAAVAMLLAAAAVELLLPAFANLTGAALSLDELGKGRVALYAVAIAAFAGVAAGLYPAFYLSAFEPIRVMRGDVAGGIGGGRARAALVVVQFAVSIALLVATVVVYEQTTYARRLDLGFDKDRVVVVAGGLGEQWQALKSELLRLPGVLGITASHYTPFSFNDNTLDVRPHGAAASSRIQYMAVDYGFFRTYRIDVVAGRSFSPDFGQDRVALPSAEAPQGAGGFMLNEAAAKLLGWPHAADAVGQAVEIENFAKSFSVPIVGVAADTYFESARVAVRPMIYLLFEGVWPASNMTASLRISGDDLPGTLDRIDATWRKFLPGRPVARHFLDVDFDALYEREERQGQVFAWFSSLAIFVACLGLFGLVSFTTERRTKEIGVRRVMGGTLWDIVRLLTAELGKPLLVANALAWPAAYFVMRRWLDDFAYRIDMSPWVYVGCSAAVLGVAWLTVAGVAIKAASAKPARALRYE